MIVLALNAGSSSLKYALFDVRQGAVTELLREGLERRAGHGPLHEQLPRLFARVAEASHAEPDVVVHRLVHGGPDHASPIRIDAALRRAFDAIVPFAPLHLPSALALVDAVADLRPELPQVACFDTAFHAALPEVARRLPLARELYDAGVRRYGFHGLSYEHVVDTVGGAALGRAVIAHLGSGASLAAVRDGRPVDTSMGMTPTGGVVMATRSGDLDPGILLHLARHHGYDAAALDRAVNERAGLLGISETTADMRRLLAARATDARARLAVAMFCGSVRKCVGAYAATLGGIDTLVFTGGIGERAPEVRAEICEGLAWMGIALDGARNARGERAIGLPNHPVRVLVVPADEERVLARHAADVMR